MSTLIESLAAPERVVSAAGFATVTGGSALSPGVRDAMLHASMSTWLISELQEWAGQHIAHATGAEAGWVTSGAAAGLTLAAAACIAGTDPVRIGSLPQVGSFPAEIVVQRGHRQSYDRALRAAGATLKEVGYSYSEGIGRTHEWELESALSPSTVAVAYCTRAESTGLPLATVCDIAHSHGVPVIVDAAAALPPAANLKKFIEQGADMVVFSGGKAIRGPQASGVLAGRRDLIASVRLQMLDMDVDTGIADHETFPHGAPHHGLGRSMKVGKEEIFGLVAAIQEFVATDHERNGAELEEWLNELQSAIGVGSVNPSGDGGFFPRLVIDVGNEAHARAISVALAKCTPRIVVPYARLCHGEVVVCPEAVEPHDREHVEACLKKALSQMPAKA